MTIFLLSLGGVPPTGGFFAKFYLFRAAMESPQLYWLVVLGVLNSVVSVYYYLRIVVAMYFRDALRPLAPIDSTSMRAGLLITAIAVVLLGLFPGRSSTGPGRVATAGSPSPRWPSSAAVGNPDAALRVRLTVWKSGRGCGGGSCSGCSACFAGACATNPLPPLRATPAQACGDRCSRDQLSGRLPLQRRRELRAAREGEQLGNHP